MPRPMPRLARALRVRFLPFALALLVAVLPSPPASAADPASPPTLGETLASIVDKAMTDIGALETQAKSVIDDRQALATQAAIAAAKQDLQRRLFEVQLEYARRVGDAEVIAELEGVLTRLDAPAVAVPQDRPAPAIVSNEDLGVVR